MTLRGLEELALSISEISFFTRTENWKEGEREEEGGRGRKEKREGGEGRGRVRREEQKSRKRMAYKCTIIVCVSANSSL